MDDDDFNFDFEEDFAENDDLVEAVAEGSEARDLENFPSQKDHVHPVSEIPQAIAVVAVTGTENKDLQNSIVDAENQQWRQNFDDFDDPENELLSQISDDGVFEKSAILNSRGLPQGNTDSAVVQGAATKLSVNITSCNSKHSRKLMGPPTTQLSNIRLTVTTPKCRNSLGLKDQKSAESISSSSKPTVNTANSREDFFENWDSDELSNYEKMVHTIKRRFPGPAGLLPEISQREIKLLDNSDHPLTQQISKIIASDLLQLQTESNSKSLQILTPSRDKEILRITKAPWRELLKVLNINPKDQNGLLHFMNIRWIRRKVSKHPVTTKIPFLALVVQEEPEIMGYKRKLRGRPKNPSIKLMDPSGTIFAAMDAKFVEMYGSELSPGTAIAVKNSGFLRFKRQVILTITRKNVICMTTMKKTVPNTVKKILFSKVTAARSHSIIENQPIISETSEGVRVIQFCDFCPSKAMEEYQQILNTNLDDMTEGGFSENSKEPVRLFSAIGEIPKRRGSENSDSVCKKTSNPIQGISSSGDAAEAQVSLSMDWSAFGDDDDDELMQALDNVDFLLKENESGSLP